MYRGCPQKQRVWKWSWVHIGAISEKKNHEFTIWVGREALLCSPSAQARWQNYLWRCSVVISIFGRCVCCGINRKDCVFGNTGVRFSKTAATFWLSTRFSHAVKLHFVAGTILHICAVKAPKGFFYPMAAFVVKSHVALSTSPKWLRWEWLEMLMHHCWISPCEAIVFWTAWSIQYKLRHLEYLVQDVLPAQVKGTQFTLPRSGCVSRHLFPLKAKQNMITYTVHDFFLSHRRRIFIQGRIWSGSVDSKTRRWNLSTSHFLWFCVVVLFFISNDLWIWNLPQTFSIRFLFSNLFCSSWIRFQINKKTELGCCLRTYFGALYKISFFQCTFPCRGPQKKEEARLLLFTPTVNCVVYGNAFSLKHNETYPGKQVLKVRSLQVNPNGKMIRWQRNAGYQLKFQQKFICSFFLGWSVRQLESILLTWQVKNTQKTAKIRRPSLNEIDIFSSASFDSNESLWKQIGLMF